MYRTPYGAFIRFLIIAKGIEVGYARRIILTITFMHCTTSSQNTQNTRNSLTHTKYANDINHKHTTATNAQNFYVYTQT